MTEPAYNDTPPAQMSSMASMVSGYKLPVATTKRIDHEFEAIGVEMVEHFGKEYSKRIFPLFYNVKYTVPKIRDAWVAYNKQPIKTFNYFCGILNNK